MDPITTHMKPYLLPVLFGFGLFQMSAQSVTISNEPAPVEYVRMPDHPLPTGYTTYSAEVEIPFGELSKTGYTESYLVDTYLNLEGYKRVRNNSDVEITASIGDFFIWNEARNSHKSKTKDKEGNEYIKYTYSLEVKYSLPMGVQVLDREGHALLDTYVFSNGDTRTWTSSTFNSLSELESYWRSERPTRLTTLQRDFTKEGMNKISDLINTSFGYRIIKDKIRFAAIGKKKHPDYDRFQNNVEILKSAFQLMRADKSLDAVREKATPALDFYKEMADSYKTGNQDQKKLKQICLYNLALAYCWLEDFETAETYARSILRFDSKNKDVKRLLDEIEYTRSSLINAGQPSRHQVVLGSKT